MTLGPVVWENSYVNRMIWPSADNDIVHWRLVSTQEMNHFFNLKFICWAMSGKLSAIETHIKRYLV